MKKGISFRKKIFDFVSNNYNKGKKIANHATWFVLLSFGVIGYLIIEGDIEIENFEMLVGWAEAFQYYFLGILGLRVGGGGWKAYVDTKHGNRNGEKPPV